MAHSPTRSLSEDIDTEAIDDLIREGAGLVERLQQQRRRGGNWITILVVGLVASMGTASLIKWNMLPFLDFAPAGNGNESVNTWNYMVNNRVSQMPLDVAVGATETLSLLNGMGQTLEDLYYDELTDKVMGVADSGSAATKKLADYPESWEAFRALNYTRSVLNKEARVVRLSALQGGSVCDEFQGILLLAETRLFRRLRDAGEAVEQLESTLKTVLDRMGAVLRIFELMLPQLWTTARRLQLLHLALSNCIQALEHACASSRNPFSRTLSWMAGGNAYCTMVGSEVATLKAMANKLELLPRTLQGITDNLRQYSHVLEQRLVAGFATERGLQGNWTLLETLRQQTAGEGQGDSDGVRKAVAANYLTLLGELELHQVVRTRK